MTGDLFHGGALDQMAAAFPKAPGPWIDLSTGINPWPYPVPPLPLDTFHHLPEWRAVDACRRAMATAFNAPERRVMVVPGTEVVIRLLPTILTGDRVTIAAPTYGDHARSWKAAGRHVVECHDPFVETPPGSFVVLCNPNNPDGRRWPVSHLEDMRSALAREGCMLIVDEAYADLKPDQSMAPLAGRDSLIILRSFGKFFGLAGLRLGAFLAPPSLAEAMAEKLGVWSVSGPALWLGERAYRDLSWQARTREVLNEGRRELDRVLMKAGLELRGGTDLFRYVGVDNAHVVWRHLAEHGIYVRRFDWSANTLRLGLPPSDAALARLAQALAASCAGPDG